MTGNVSYARSSFMIASWCFSQIVVLGEGKQALAPCTAEHMTKDLVRWCAHTDPKVLHISAGSNWPGVWLLLSMGTFGFLQVSRLMRNIKICTAQTIAGSQCVNLRRALQVTVFKITQWAIVSICVLLEWVDIWLRLSALSHRGFQRQVLGSCTRRLTLTWQADLLIAKRGARQYVAS